MVGRTPFIVENIPEDIIGKYGDDLTPEVSAWCNATFRGMWCSVFSYTHKTMHVEFEHENEALHFMMRWFNGI